MKRIPAQRHNKALLAACVAAATSFGAIQVVGQTATATPDVSAAARAADQNSNRKDLTENHTDAYRIVVDGDTITPKVRNGIANNEYNPEDVTLVIGKEGFFSEDTPLDEDEKLVSFDPPAYFSLNSEMNPGWNVSYPEDKFSSMHLEFTKVSGPGKVAIFSGSPDGEKPEDALLKDGDYWIKEGSILPVKGHSHPQWVFEKAGEYALTTVATAVRKDGSELKSREFTVYFRVEKHENDDRPDTTTPAEPTTTQPTTTAAEPTTTQPTSTTAEPASGNNDTTKDPVEDPAKARTPLPSNTDELPVDNQGQKVVRDHGHMDLFNVTPQGKNTALVIKDDTDTKEVLRDPADVTLRVKENAYISKLGGKLTDIAPSGYFLSQNGTKQGEMLFPGWDTSSTQFSNYGKTTFRFLDVSGPGDVHLLQMDTRNPKAVLHDLATGKETYTLASGTALTQEIPAHAHAHWIFTKPGTYTMKVQASSYPTNGGATVHSNVATYTWVVGEDEAQPTPAPTTTAPTTTAKPAPTTTAKPAPTTTVKPAPTTTAKPAPTTTAKPAPTTTAKPAPTTTAKPAPTTTAKPAPTTTAKPAPTTTAKPAPTTKPGGGSTDGSDSSGSSTGGIIAIIVALLGLLGLGVAAFSGLIPGVKLR